MQTWKGCFLGVFLSLRTGTLDPVAESRPRPLPLPLQAGVGGIGCQVNRRRWNLAGPRESLLLTMIWGRGLVSQLTNSPRSRLC